MWSGNCTQEFIARSEYFSGSDLFNKTVIFLDTIYIFADLSKIFCLILYTRNKTDSSV